MNAFYVNALAHREAIIEVCNEYGISELDIFVLMMVHGNIRPMYVKDVVRVLGSVDGHKIVSLVERLWKVGWLQSPGHELQLITKRLYGISLSGIAVLDSYKYHFENIHKKLELG